MTKSIFAHYGDTIYEVSQINKDKVRLISQNGKDINIGFNEKKYPDIYLGKENLPKLFIKEVDKSSLAELYSLEYKAIYQDQEFDLIINRISGEKSIGTSNAEFARKYSLGRVDKYYYKRKVQDNEIRIIKEKKSLI